MQHTKTLKEYIKSNQSNSLEKYVAKSILKHSKDYAGQLNPIKSFLQDLQNTGCISGLITELIHYDDTHKFYDKYYNEIEDLRTEQEQNFGEPLKIVGDLKNFFAWYAYEETAYQIAYNILNIEF